MFNNLNDLLSAILEYAILNDFKSQTISLLELKIEDKTYSEIAQILSTTPNAAEQKIQTLCEMFLRKTGLFSKDGKYSQSDIKKLTPEQSNEIIDKIITSNNPEITADIARILEMLGQGQDILTIQKTINNPIYNTSFIQHLDYKLKFNYLNKIGIFFDINLYKKNIRNLEEFMLTPTRLVKHNPHKIMTNEEADEVYRLIHGALLTKKTQLNNFNIEEMIQDCMLLIVSNWGDYEESKGKLSSWVYKIVENYFFKTLSHYKKSIKNGTQPFSLDNNDDQTSNEDYNLYTYVSSDESTYGQVLYNEMVEGLSEIEKMKLYGLDEQTIANILGITKEEVESILATKELEFRKKWHLPSITLSRRSQVLDNTKILEIYEFIKNNPSTREDSIKMFELYMSGKDMVEIANLFNISKQRVYQILSKIDSQYKEHLETIQRAKEQAEERERLRKLRLNNPPPEPMFKIYPAKETVQPKKVSTTIPISTPKLPTVKQIGIEKQKEYEIIITQKVLEKVQNIEKYAIIIPVLQDIIDGKTIEEIAKERNLDSRFLNTLINKLRRDCINETGIFSNNYSY